MLRGNKMDAMATFQIAVVNQSLLEVSFVQVVSQRPPSTASSKAHSVEQVAFHKVKAVGIFLPQIFL
jgi:hypothetical protein